MSFDLKSISSTRRDTPARILIYGPHKIGKSTFAAQAEGVIFIPTEDGQDAIDAQAFPLCKTWQDLLSCITTLYSDSHKFKTVVIDSADWAEALAHKQVCVNFEKPITSIEEIGYGKGYVFSANLFRELLDGLNALRTKCGMQVIILCHAEIRRFDDPMADSYDRYQIKMHKLVSKMVQEWCDVIGFAQQEIATKTTEGKGFKKDETRTRAMDIDRRVLRLSGSAAFDAGNRYDLPTSVPLIWSEFETALNAARKAGK